MKIVLQAIRILVVILIIEEACCQDGYSQQDILRLQQMAANEGQIETITSYSTNIIQRDPNSQSISSVSVQYHMTDDSDESEENNRSDRSRIKKVYHIKNPFQRHPDEDNRSEDTKTSHLDNGTGASNQYAAMQYSLPPEEFLQQMRKENQYHQQQQQQQQQQQSHQQPQLSTQSSSLGYTATPQPQYQFSTISASNYDIGNQQSNQIPHLEPKSLAQVYHTGSNNFPYNSPNSFGLDIVQSTPSPISHFLSTPLPNNQYLATPSNTYVSSSSPMYLSSPPSLQQYVSSPLSNIQTGSPDYASTRITTTIGSNSLSYDNIDLHKRMQIDHYDNSANGVRFPTHQQYQHEYPSSTISPSSPFPDHSRELWQNTLNSGADSKPHQETSQSQFQNLRYNNNNQHDSRQDMSYDNANSETHRIGSLPAANNVYLNFVQPDYQLLNNLKSRAREYEQQTQVPEYYSHGDYGWKLAGKKSFGNQEGPTQANYPRYQLQQADNNAASQMNFHLDTSKSYNYDQTSKSGSEQLDSQEFAKAAAKAHEHYKKQQMEGNNYATSTQYSHSLNLGPNAFSNSNDQNKQKTKLYADSFSQNSYSQNNQNDLITLSPYYYSNVNENSLDTKVKYPFDHNKALKNIVPIDVTNVVSNSENQVRQSPHLDSNNRYSLSNFANEHSEQNIKQYYKPLTDSYYKDKNAVYGFNIKTKPEEPVVPDRLKQIESNVQLQGNPQSSESYYNHGIYNDNKRLTDDTTQPHYVNQLNNYQDSHQSSANVQQQGVSRPLSQITSDLSSILKLNDIPFRLTQGVNADSFRLHNNNFDQTGIPTPLPVRINQNVDNHQIDVATSILNKLMSNKPNGLSVSRPAIEPQNGNILSTINGFNVANPYNVDLKLVADMLKGKPTIDETNMSPLRDQFNKPVPLKLDLSQLQQLLLKNENTNLGLLNTGLSGLSNPYFEIYNPSGYYQGVKYSRSQEEEENIPIADGSSNHPIGAVMEEADPINEQEVSTDSDTTAIGDDDISLSLTEDRPKNAYSSSLRSFVERHRHPNSLLQGRHSMQRKYPKSDIGEPYPLLKPPPRSSRNRAFHNSDKHNRRRRVNKPKVLRIFKTEPLFEAESSIEEDDKPTVTTLLKPPPPVAQDKSDQNDENMEGA